MKTIDFWLCVNKSETNVKNPPPPPRVTLDGEEITHVQSDCFLVSLNLLFNVTLLVPLPKSHFFHSYHQTFLSFPAFSLFLLLSDVSRAFSRYPRIPAIILVSLPVLSRACYHYPRIPALCCRYTEDLYRACRRLPPGTRFSINLRFPYCVTLQTMKLLVLLLIMFNYDFRPISKEGSVIRPDTVSNITHR